MPFRTVFRFFLLFFFMFVCSFSLRFYGFYIGLVGLQAAVMEPQICKGIVLLNISLRMLHIKKQPWFGRPFIRSFQNLLR